MECVHGLYLPNSELCPDDHIWMSLREYSWYIREQMAGLDPEQCQGTVLVLAFLELIINRPFNYHAQFLFKQIF